MRALIVRLTVVFAALVAGGETMAYEQVFPKTPVDEIQVRRLPPARWLTTETEGVYFQQSDQLFMRLFRFIESNDVAMTVPVEGSLEGASMRFYLGRDVPASLTGSDTVSIVEAPARQVVSIGGRGSYDEENVGEARRRLEAWIREQRDWAADGKPYAVFWNGPFTPWFMKRFEVHIPVAERHDG